MSASTVSLPTGLASVERVTEDTSRDCWMSAEESVEYGLIGKIISSIDEVS